MQGALVNRVPGSHVRCGRRSIRSAQSEAQILKNPVKEIS